MNTSWADSVTDLDRRILALRDRLARAKRDVVEMKRRQERFGADVEDATSGEPAARLADARRALDRLNDEMEELRERRKRLIASSKKNG